jgi:hypothetical protein
MLYRGLLHVAVVLGNRGLVLSRMHLRSEKGFETRVIESFELANSKKGYLTEFPRCKGRVVSTTYSYGCPKCIAIATNVYRKCQCQNPKCLIHKRNLVLQSPPTDISRNAYLSDATRRDFPHQPSYIYYPKCHLYVLLYAPSLEIALRGQRSLLIYVVKL